MTSHVATPKTVSLSSRVCAAVMTTTLLLALPTTSIAATIGFSGNVAGPTHRALVPESHDIVTFTNRVGIRFRSENTAAEPIKLRLSIRDSAGHTIKPVSISGNSIIKPKNQNLITLVLPMAQRSNEVFELCLQHVNKARSVLNRTCSKLSVARLN